MQVAAVDARVEGVLPPLPMPIKAPLASASPGPERLPKRKAHRKTSDPPMPAAAKRPALDIKRPDAPPHADSVNVGGLVLKDRTAAVWKLLDGRGDSNGKVEGLSYARDIEDHLGWKRRHANLPLQSLKTLGLVTGTDPGFIVNRPPMQEAGQENVEPWSKLALENFQVLTTEQTGLAQLVKAFAVSPKGRITKRSELSGFGLDSRQALAASCHIRQLFTDAAIRVGDGVRDPLFTLAPALYNAIRSIRVEHDNSLLAARYEWAVAPRKYSKDEVQGKVLKALKDALPGSLCVKEIVEKTDLMTKRARPIVGHLVSIALVIKVPGRPVRYKLNEAVLAKPESAPQAIDPSKVDRDSLQLLLWLGLVQTFA